MPMSPRGGITPTTPENETVRTTRHCEGCGKDIVASEVYSGAHYWRRGDGYWDSCGPVERTDKP